MVEKAIAEKDMVNKPAAVGLSPLVELLGAVVVGVCAVLAGSIVDLADPVSGIFQHFIHIVIGIKQMIPLRYIGEAQDIANAAVFLLSSKARYITGQTLAVDGGLQL